MRYYRTPIDYLGNGCVYDKCGISQNRQSKRCGCVFYITLYCIWIVVCIVGVCQHSGDVWHKVEDFF